MNMAPEEDNTLKKLSLMKRKIKTSIDALKKYIQGGPKKSLHLFDCMNDRGERGELGQGRTGTLDLIQ